MTETNLQQVKAEEEHGRGNKLTFGQCAQIVLAFAFVVGMLFVQTAKDHGYLDRLF